MKKLKILYLTILVFGLAFLIQSCSQVDDNLVTSPSLGIHPAGWLTPTAADFHGKSIADNKWNMSSCKTCHAPDYKGGSSGKSCYDCHTSGPEGCRVCHGNSSHSYPPAGIFGQTSVSYIGVGVHEKHLGDSTLRQSAKVACVACHRKISGYSDTVHINPKNVNNIAEVVFDSLSKVPTGGITPNPTWTRTSATCAGTYCHGNFKNGNFRLITGFSNPVWTTAGGAGCGTCHGNPTTGNPLPGGTHIQGYTTNQCWWCHPRVIDSTGHIINKSRHINGIIDLGFDKNIRLR